jgi:hypothetical protein
MKILTDPRSGSYQGLTASRNRNGQYVRTRAIPVQPRTSFQSLVRSRMSSASANYRTLTPYQIGAWTSLGLLMVRRDSLGQSGNLTGAQANTSINLTLQAYDQPTTDDPPLLTTPVACSSITLTVDSVTPTLTVATADEPLTGFVGIYAAPPQTGGRTFIQGFRLLRTFAVGGSPYDILTPWNERFGTLIAGQKVAIQVRSMLNGFESLGTPGAAIAS